MKWDEQKYADIIAEEIRKEIDWDIMRNLLKDMGWTEMKFYPIRSAEECAGIKEWCRTQMSGQVQSLGEHWMFEKEADAMMFRLRWGV